MSSMRKEGPEGYCRWLLVSFFEVTYMLTDPRVFRVIQMLHTQADVQAQVSIYPVLRGSLK